jgi:hypothetical protein
MKLKALFFSVFFAVQAFAVGTVTVTKSTVDYGKSILPHNATVVTIDWTADASDGSVPVTAIDLKGFVVRAETVPGSPAPTALYDIALYSPNSSTLDAFNSALKDRSTSASEQVAPMLTSAASPLFVAGSYTFTLTNNSVNSAKGKVYLYLVE